MGGPLLRRVSYAVDALAAAAGASAVVGPKTVDAATALHPAAGLSDPVPSARFRLCSPCDGRARPLVLRQPASPWSAQRWGSARLPFMAYHGIIPVHLLLGAAMLLGVVFSGGFARLLQHARGGVPVGWSRAALTAAPPSRRRAAGVAARLSGGSGPGCRRLRATWSATGSTSCRRRRRSLAGWESAVCTGIGSCGPPSPAGLHPLRERSRWSWRCSSAWGRRVSCNGDCCGIETEGPRPRTDPPDSCLQTVGGPSEATRP